MEICQFFKWQMKFARVLLLCYVYGMIPIANGQYRLAPKNTIGVEGQSATIYCAINGLSGVVVWNHIVSGRPTLQLSVGGRIDLTVSGKDNRIAVIGNRGRGEYHLRIKNVRMSDAGRYECMGLVGLTRIVKRSAALRVVRTPRPGYPVCQMEPPFGLAPGMEVVFSCETMGGIPKARVRWYDGNKILTPNKEGQVSYTHTLTAADYGQPFICQEITPAYRTPRTCEVTPLEIDLKVDLQPSPRAQARPGSTITFTCYGQGTGKFSYNWQLNDQPLPFDRNIIVSGPNGHKLTITGITAATNNALISCMLINRHGFTARASSVITIMAYDRPVDKPPEPTIPFLSPGTVPPHITSDLEKPIRPIRPGYQPPWRPPQGDYEVHFESEIAGDWGMDPPSDAGVSPSTMTAIASVLVGILIGIFIAVGVVLGKRYFKANPNSNITSALYNRHERTQPSSVPPLSYEGRGCNDGPSLYDLPPRDYPRIINDDDDPEGESYLGLRPESMTSNKSVYLGLHSPRPRSSTYHPESYYSQTDDYEAGNYRDYYEDVLNQDTRESVYHYRFSPPIDPSEIHPRCMSADRATRHFFPR